jgi:uncharacterized protein (TIGR00266 family)
MQIDIECRPAFSIATILLELEETFYVDSGSLSMLSAGIDIHASAPGGATRAFLRREIAHESLLMTACTAKLDGAWITAAPRYPGDILELTVRPDEPMYAEAGCMLGFSKGVSADARYAGLGNIALHQGAAALRVTGSGMMLVCAYGGTQSFNLADGESIFVDTGFLLAWSQSCKFKVGPLQGIISSKLTGEGLVAQITGPGVVHTQSRAQQGLREWLFPGLGPNLNGQNPSR